MKRRRAVVYGAERFAQYAQHILEKYEVIGILDPAYQGKTIQGIPIFDYRCLIALVYDYVLLIEGRDNSGVLIHSYGVPWDKICLYVHETGNEWDDVVYTVYKDKIKASFDAIQFFLKNKTDFLVAHEVFCQDEYSFFLRDVPCAVFDVGMNVGIATLYFAQKKNVVHVYSFEPFPETYVQATENFKLNADILQSKITAFNFGLSNQDSEEIFPYMPDYPGNARTVREGSEMGQGCEKYDVKVTLKNAAKILRPLFEHHRNEDIIMKIDCEGAEYAIFDSLNEAGLIPSVKAFLIETHLGKEAALKKCLQCNGFAYFSPYMGGENKNGMLYAVQLSDS